MPWLHIALMSAAGIIGVAAVAVVALFAWPTYLPALRRVPVQPKYSYAEAAKLAQDTVERDVNDSNVIPECRSIFLRQPNEQAKAVLLLHGYVACPSQMRGLAEAMFAAGYTVYVPRAPIHGEYDHQKLMVPVATDLLDYANRSASIIGGLSSDAGAIGLSGGGVLTSWLAHYRSDVIKHVEIFNPFFEPAAAKAPKWKIHPLLVLYGLTHVLPNVPDGPHGSYRGLAAYMLIARNIPAEPSKVESAALVLSPGDDLTDLDVSQRRFAQWFAQQGKAYRTPVSWGFKHDNTTRSELGTYADVAYADYVRAYKGQPPAQLEQQ